MTDDITRAELAQLRTRVAQLETRQRSKPRLHRLRRFAPLAIVGLLVALMPLSLLAAGPVFSDLGTAAPVHQPNIQAIGDAGITTGFEDPADPTKRLYNPKELVTREEMASFLARTAGLGNNKPVANAARLAPADPTAGGPTYAANDLVRVARRSNSDTLPLTSVYQQYGGPLTITAPVKGFVQVTVAFEIRVSNGTGCPCEVDVYLKRQGGDTSDLIEQTVPAINDYRAMVPLVWVFAVDPGVQTIAIEAVRFNGTGTVQGYYSRASALFVPFGNGGAGTLDTENAPAIKKP